MSSAALNADKRKLLLATLPLFNDQLCGIANALEEPFKTQFLKAKGDFDTLLAGLPPTDMTKVADEVNWQLDRLMNCLLSLQGCLNVSSGAIVTMKSQYSSAVMPDQVEAKIKEAIEGKVKAGELFPQTTVTQLCSDAKASAEKALKVEFENEKKQLIEQHKNVADRSKIVSARASQLSSAKFPVPALEDILALPEDQFTAAKTTAESRLKKLTEAGIENQDLLCGMIWLPEADYANQEKFALSLLKSAGAPNPSLPPGKEASSDKPKLPSFA